ncbi:MAG: hypothetical protein IJV00_04180 [Clostridia bacterium]|nr:hypothetical protein [Clostridia bacterium]
MPKNEGEAPKKLKKQSVPSRVREAIEPTLISLGYVLWDVELVREGGELDLVVTIDKPGGVGIADCEAVTRAIDPIIDDLDPIRDAYCLEVSSAGLEKVLRTPQQIASCFGEKVDVRFYAAPDSGPFAGVKHSQATLTGLDGENVVLEKDSQSFSVPLASVSRLSTVLPDGAFET